MKNSGITLVDVREEAMEAICKIKSGEMDIDKAKTIKGLLDTVVSTAKVQVDFLNALPKNIKDHMNEVTVKAIAGTLRDRDAELDETLNDIERKKNSYQLHKQ